MTHIDAAHARLEAARNATADAEAEFMQTAERGDVQATRIAHSRYFTQKADERRAQADYDRLATANA